MEFQNLFLLYLRNEFGDSEIKPSPTRSRTETTESQREAPQFRRAQLVAVDRWLLDRSSLELWALAATIAVLLALAVIATC
jgi:hypothetical protein